MKNEQNTTSNDATLKVIQFRINAATSQMRRVLGKLDAFAREIPDTVEFEIGDWPGFVPCPCDICQQHENAPSRCVRIKGFGREQGAYGYVCQQCAKIFAPDLLAQAEAEEDQRWQEEEARDQREQKQGADDGVIQDGTRVFDPANDIL